MTEAEWLTCDDPGPMLESLRGNLSERKLRLFAVTCCRRIWHLLDDCRSRSAVEITERNADGLTGKDELMHASVIAEAAFHSISWESNRMPGARKMAASTVWGATASSTEDTIFGGEPVAGFAFNTALQAADAADKPKSERFAQAAFLRDIFGNPFRPVGFDPAWRSSDVELLARGIYDERAFDRLPILADALQDTGCDCDDLLTHLRDTAAPHVRGCWALDLVLGKE